jgi:F-type H+-transporting ATPase subunit epsilon
MNKPFTLYIRTPEEVAFEGQATSVISPAGKGYLGVWADHAPLVSVVSAGRLKFQLPTGDWQALLIKAGVLEVVANQMTLLVEGVEGAAAPAHGPFA